MYVHQAKPANPERTIISLSLMGISESSFDYPPTNERRCAFQSRIKYASGRGSAKSLRALSTGSSSWSVVGIGRAG
jgi:hypothetical protein